MVHRSGPQRHEAPPSYPKCQPCQKMAFPTAEVATEMVLRAKIAKALRGRQRRREVRWYECPEGHGYHVTSWETSGHQATGDA